MYMHASRPSALHLVVEHMYIHTHKHNHTRTHALHRPPAAVLDIRVTLHTSYTHQIHALNTHTCVRLKVAMKFMLHFNT